jgi:HAE1 family hydrophobic/amphiphilic exporter-1/multidrug efflux pump
LSQEEIADQLTKWTKQYPNAKTSVTQPTNFRKQASAWWFTNTIHYSNSKFGKLEEKIPLFMEADNDPTFSMSDVNLKFNKPELNVDQKKAESLGISVIDIAQTFTAFPEWTTFGYFMKKENNTK